MIIKVDDVRRGSDPAPWSVEECRDERIGIEDAFAGVERTDRANEARRTELHRQVDALVLERLDAGYRAHELARQAGEHVGAVLGAHLTGQR